MKKILFLILLVTLTLPTLSQRLLMSGAKSNYVAPINYVDLEYPVTGGSFSEVTANRWGSGTGTGLSDSYIPALADGTYECELALSENRGVDIGLDAANTNTDYFQYDYGLFVDATGAQEYYYIVNGTFTNSGIPATLGDKYRIRRTSGTVYAEYYRGGVWTTIFTFSGTSTGILYIKAHLTFSSKYLLNPKGTGVVSN